MTALERLIGACVDDGDLLGYGELLDPPRRLALARLARQRTTSVAELTTSGRTLHHTPCARRSWSGVWRGLMLDAAFFAGGANAGDVIQACRRSQARLEASFAAARREPVAGTWSDETRQILSEQHEKIRRARALLLSLI